MAGKGFTVKKNWDNPIEHAMPANARVPAEVRIGAVLVAPATVLAPMAGVTDTVFRRFIRHASLLHARARVPRPESRSSRRAITNPQSGCGLLMTEFTSADGLVPHARIQAPPLPHLLRRRAPHRRPALRVQRRNPRRGRAHRRGHRLRHRRPQPRLPRQARRRLQRRLRPAPRPAQNRRNLRAVRKAVSIPFTVKFRMGWNDPQIVCVDLARMAESEGLNAVALHARTREQGYSGQAHWQWIAAIKQAVSIPVIGNGDIRTPEDAAAMIDQTGCDAVMIGRAAPANPWIFRQIAQYTADRNLRPAHRRRPLPHDPRLFPDASR